MPPRAWIWLASLTAAAAAPPFFQKGVNFTAEFPGGYSSDAAEQMLRQLPKHGIDAIALVPYGFTPRNSTAVRMGGSLEREEGIERLARVAHELHIKVLLKPQIWTGRGGFPGDIDFDKAAGRAEWFAQYRLFLERYATLATRIRADLFCVGTEFGKLSRYEDEWRKLIARARQLYSGPLVYAATQGPEFERITFWRELDYIGLNNYYPLPDDLSAAAVVAKVETVQKRYGKPVIFTEAGFSSYEAPHRQPWDETPRKLSMKDQADCYEAIFRAFYTKPWFQGMYWWKVGTNGAGGPENGAHTPWGKPAMEVLARWYRSGRR